MTATPAVDALERAIAAETRAERAEAALQRVRDLADDFDKRGALHDHDGAHNIAATYHFRAHQIRRTIEGQ
jgi:hypothetical protein